MVAGQAIAPGKGSIWRPLTKREVLPDLESDSMFPAELVTQFASHGRVLGGGPVPGAKRCSATGLLRGDCHMHRLGESRYCYYHTKVLRGEIEVDHPRETYPVWPLPVTGYQLLDTEQTAAA